MAVKQFNLAKGQRAERKSLITVAEWFEYTVLATEPADWSDDYGDYYEKIDGQYVKVSGASAPTFEANKYYSQAAEREILGTRTPNSAVEYNPDIETSTDIRGINYTDVNKTQPQQSFDPHLVLGGAKLGAKLNDIRRRNAVSELSQFNFYIITAFVGDATNGYEAEMHTGCTCSYTSIGGDTNVNFPINIYFSNVITTGTVDKLSDDFTFTPDVTV